MHNVKRVLVHLLNDQYDFAHAPDVIHVTNIHLRVDIEFSAVHLALLLSLHVRLLPFNPVRLYLLILCILYELVNDIVDLEADAVGFIPDHDALHPVKIADKASLKNDKTYLKSQTYMQFSCSSLTSLKSK